MQRNDLAEKHIWEIDGVEVAGLVKSGELVLDRGTIDVPEFNFIRKIQNGITVIPAVEAIYKIKAASDTLKFFRDWFQNNEVKEIVKIRTDASGTEFARTIYQDCECIKYSEPEFDGAAPIFAQINMIFLPYDIILLDAL